MNQEHRTNAHVVPTSLHVNLILDEAWIERFLEKQEVIVPITQKYNLTGLSIQLFEDKVVAQADIKEKQGTQVKVSCHPVWNNTTQQIRLEKIEIQLVSKNILVKGAGWFAKTVMGAKLEKKVEQALNQTYQKLIRQLLEEGLNLPLPDAGQAVIRFNAMHISEMEFRTQQVKMKVSMNGQGSLHLR